MSDDKQMEISMNRKGNLSGYVNGEWVHVLRAHPAYEVLHAACVEDDADTFLKVYNEHVVDFSRNDAKSKSVKKSTKLSDNEIRKRFEERIEYLLNEVEMPSYEEIEPLAEYCCRALLKSRDISKFTLIKQDEHNEFGLITPVFLEDIDEIISSVGTATKADSKELAHFLDLLYAPEEEIDSVKCRWRFTTMMDKYSSLISHVGAALYTEFYATIYDPEGEVELKYYEEHDDEYKEAERKHLLRRLDFEDMFYRYLYAQDWHRFIPDAKECVGAVCKRYLESYPQLTLDDLRESIGAVVKACKIRYTGGSKIDMILNKVDGVELAKPKSKCKKKEEVTFWRHPDSDYRTAVESGMVINSLVTYKQYASAAIDVLKEEGYAVRELIITIDDMLAELKKRNLDNTMDNCIAVAEIIAKERGVDVSDSSNAKGKLF